VKAAPGAALPVHQFERAKIEALLNAINAAPRSLCRHSCGAWTIRPRRRLGSLQQVIACVSKHDAYCEVEHLRNRAVDRTDLKECKPLIWDFGGRFGVLAETRFESAWVVAQSGPLDQERVSDLASATGRGDEIKLDPNTLSLINAACT
jgi:hypothetical protein